MKASAPAYGTGHRTASEDRSRLLHLDPDLLLAVDSPGSTLCCIVLSAGAPLAEISLRLGPEI